MTATARFDLKIDASDKDMLSRAASLMGTPMAGFVRQQPRKKPRVCWTRSPESRYRSVILRRSKQLSRVRSPPTLRCKTP